jgi:hypothetical protein
MGDIAKLRNYQPVKLNNKNDKKSKVKINSHIFVVEIC